MNKTILVISDSTGETANQVLDAVKVHFDITDVDIKKYSKINKKEQIDEILEDIKGDILIFSTIVDRELLDYLIEKTEMNESIYLVDVLSYPMLISSKFFGQQPRFDVGLNRKVDQEYLEKMEALEFAVKYDDCKDKFGILKADIILIGVSRTSKTPLSLNLAFKNYKVCNIPILPEVEIPSELYKVDNKKIIGLIIDSDKLNNIREDRMAKIGLQLGYSDDFRIEKELEYAKKIMNKIGCKIINVTDKTIDETSNEIISYIDKYK
ncbi:pyruvate, water dikinase regulatory protein [Finegoldia magna]|uniref:pyruvate, water dikinase regulatory protein n=1 Tax=Finegoldia magna TaxID=1260 RepID=UPI0012B00759|nr:pyruvate, water dikinase regulatory protein [Finegoldia magna]MSB17134.1 pyruvate, phosphate dikinase/phosphoenolpyruvate synthase regulator [Finegoldia magna]MSD45941.1 pyruvate, phosphate dikinase/phosphoenolpyruvate synthase regulator [Finegoldia magna]